MSLLDKLTDIARKTSFGLALLISLTNQSYIEAGPFHPFLGRNRVERTIDYPKQTTKEQIKPQTNPEIKQDKKQRDGLYGVRLENADEPNPTKDFDYTLMKNGEGVSFEGNRLIFKTSESKIRAYFDKENNYLQIDESDEVTMDIFPESEIVVERQSDKYKISKIKVKAGKICISDGRIIIDKDGENIVISESNHVDNSLNYPSNRFNRKSSSPTEIVFYNIDGSEPTGNFSTGSKIKGKKLIVDNFNRIAVAPVETDETLTEIDGANIRFSISRSYNYPDENEITRMTGKHLFFKDIPKGYRDVVLGKLRDYWKEIPQIQKDSIRNIYFLTLQELNRIYGPSDYPAIMEPNSGDIRFVAADCFNLEVVYHEAVHAFHFRLYNSFLERHPEIVNTMISANRNIGDFSKRLIESRKKLHTLVKEDKPDKIAIEKKEKQIRLYQDKVDEYERQRNQLLANAGFFSRWYKISGDYDKCIVDFRGIHFYREDYELEDEEFKKKFSELGFEWLKRPIHSYVSSAGGLNIFEDFATFNARAKVNPGFFHELVDEKNPKYDVRYRQKLDFSLEAGGIDRRTYMKALNLE